MECKTIVDTFLQTKQKFRLILIRKKDNIIPTDFVCVLECHSLRRNLDKSDQIRTAQPNSRSPMNILKKTQKTFFKKTGQRTNRRQLSHFNRNCNVMLVTESCSFQRSSLFKKILYFVCQ